MVYGISIILSSVNIELISTVKYPFSSCKNQVYSFRSINITNFVSYFRYIYLRVFRAISNYFFVFIRTTLN